LDIGTGSGLLAMYAHDTDPSNNVMACEMLGEVASLAAEIFRRNRKDEKIKLYVCSSDELEEHGLEPFTVDLAVMEVFDAGLLGEHVLPTLKNAHARLLSGRVAQTSKIIPCKAEVYIAPIECPYQVRQYRVLPRMGKPPHSTVNIGHLKLDRIQLINSEVDAEPYSSEKLETVPLGFEFLAHAVKVTTMNFESKREIESFINEGRDFDFEVEINKPGSFDGFALWFKLILVEGDDIECDISTGPYSYSDCCWQQAIFPINKGATPPQTLHAGDRLKVRVRIQDHISLEHCHKSAGHPEINGYHEYTTIHVPRTVVTELNDPLLMDAFGDVATNVCSGTEGSLQILDYTNSAVIALNILEQKVKSKLSLVVGQGGNEDGFVDEQEVPDTESRMRFVSEISERNGLVTANIDAIGFMVMEEDAYDVILVDPVESTGKLNESVMKKLPVFNRCISSTSPRRVGILPSKLSLFCQLIECQQIHKMFFVRRGDYTCHLYEVGAVMNAVSTLHQQDMTLCCYDFKPLSNPVHVYDLDLNAAVQVEEDSEKVEKKLKTPVTQEGCAHLLVYWFELDYGSGVRLPTFYPEDPARSFHYRQAMISLKNPVRVTKNGHVEFTFLYQNGLLDFVCEDHK